MYLRHGVHVLHRFSLFYMQRFFFHTPLQENMVITDRARVHQMTRVLRLQVGDEIIGIDGDGSESLYEIVLIDKTAIQLLRKKRYIPDHREADRHICLYHALPNKFEKIEWIIQKSVEIGVRRLVFFRAERSQKLVLSESKKERFATIAVEALEQCGGLIPLDMEFSTSSPLTESKDCFL